MFKKDHIAAVLGGEDAQWDAKGARALGAACADVSALAGRTLVLGRDGRRQGEAMARAFALGAVARGASVVDLGVCNRDEVYFHSGRHDMPGVHIGAADQPPEVNGASFCGAGAQPMAPGFLAALAERAIQIDQLGELRLAQRVGSWDKGSSRADYIRHLRNQVWLDELRELTVVLDASGGTAGQTAPQVLRAGRVRLLGLNLEIDREFRAHQPDPRQAHSQAQARSVLLRHGADFAVVTDAVGEGCVVLDELGEVVAPAALAALLGPGVRELNGRLQLEALWGSSSAQLLALRLVDLLGHQELPLSGLLPVPMLRRSEAPAVISRQPRATREVARTGGVRARRGLVEEEGPQVPAIPARRAAAAPRRARSEQADEGIAQGW